MATAKITPAPLTRPLGAVMADIRRDYEMRGKPIYFAAKPYVLSLSQVSTTDLGSSYYSDSVDTLVITLLGNLSTWRGETATRVKAELRAALAHHAATRRTR